MTRTTKLTLVAIAILLVAGVGWYVLTVRNDNSMTDVSRQQQDNETSDKEGSVDLSPPSEEQQQAESESNKDQPNVNEDQSANNNQDVDVVLTRVTVTNDLVTAAGYVDINQPGTCTLTFRSSASTKTYTDNSQEDPANPENENCSNFRIPKSDLSAAKEWTATLSYSAEGLRGESQKWVFEL